jgi:hypothetical protein
MRQDGAGREKPSILRVCKRSVMCHSWTPFSEPPVATDTRDVMSTRRIIIAALLAPALAGCGENRNCEARDTVLLSDADRPVSLDTANLNLVKSEYARDDSSAACARPYDHVIAALAGRARRLAAAAPASVMDKTGVAPSGDKHDYLTIGRYFWPDPKHPDGKWVARDGEVNPQSLSAEYDKVAVERMFEKLDVLPVAYFLSGDESLAEAAVRQLDTWFVDPATRMNPRLTYAQGVPGRSAGRGQGLVEFINMNGVVNGITLLRRSPAWTDALESGLRVWLTQFVAWMRTDANGLEEHTRPNNHGSWYDVQFVTDLVFLGHADDARAYLAQAFQARIEAQIAADGSQPLELTRETPWFYSCYNLRALMTLADLGDHLGIDLWHAVNARGVGIEAAAGYLADVVEGARPWDLPDDVDFAEFDDLSARALRVYGDVRYRTLLTTRDADGVRDGTLDLVLWQPTLIGN